MDKLSQNPSAALKVAFIKARWHADIVDQCHDSCAAYFSDHAGKAVELEAFKVPGAFEIPLLAQDLAKSGQYDAVIASAFVVNGGIYRHDFVSAAVIDGLMRVQLDTGVPVFSAVLTPHNFHETEDHQNFFRGHFVIKGQEVAQACLAMLDVRERLTEAA
ncbi:6,7-dimethyl-8-ribityllumazine synthase [Emcibacter sp.]|uniref:6,7-dimethyl-8-ribityllumazine synthase n=1 Tax=Emcibacter sp. TaxID=1979954 RepID=UPI003A92AB04